MKTISDMSLAQLIKTKTQIEAEMISRISKGVAAQRPKIGKRSATYRNPTNPGETWVGRGRRPLWLAAALKRGKKLSDFALH